MGLRVAGSIVLAMATVVAGAQSITTSGWSASTQTPEQMAAAADAALRQLKDATADYGSMLVEPDGSRARSEGKVWIATPTRFRIEYPFMLRTPRDIDKRILVANGTDVAMNARPDTVVDGKIVTDGRNSWVKRTKAGQQGAWAVSGVIPRWHLQAPQHILLGVGTNAKPFSRLVAEARKAGFTLSAQTRKTGSVSLERIVMRKPKHELEVIFDARTKVPLTSRTILDPKTPKVLQSVWSMKWNLTPGKRFEAKLFALPAR